MEPGERAAAWGMKLVRYLNLFARALEITIVMVLHLALRYYKRKSKERELDDQFHT